MDDKKQGAERRAYLDNQRNHIGNYEQNHIPLAIQQRVLFAEVFDTETEEGVVECREEAWCKDKTMGLRDGQDVFVSSGLWWDLPADLHQEWL
jgi:hypothetical protein